MTIAPFLRDPQAEALGQYSRSRADWRKVINSGDAQTYELDRATQASLAPDQARAPDQAVYAAARRDFPYRYETIRVPDDEATALSPGDFLKRHDDDVPGKNRSAAYVIS